MLIKKITCFVLVLCLAVLSCACTKNGAWALDIAGAEISQEVYTYFMDAVVLNPDEYGLSATPDKKAVKAKTEALCKDYVAVNTLFNDLKDPNGFKIPLGDDEKSAISIAVNGLWHLFSAHYESIGVTKQTLTKIETSKAARDALLLYYYDKDGTRAVSEDEIKAYFSENYVSFRSINGYLTKTDESGNTVALTDEEAQALKSKLQALAVRIADGESFEQVSEKFAEDQGVTVGSTDFKRLGKNDSAYPAGFFEQVVLLAPDEPGVIAIDNYIFLVVKREISLSEGNYAQSLKECLKALRGAELDQMITDAAAEYETISHERITNKIYKKTVS